MDASTITPEQIQDLINYRKKRTEQLKKWRDANREKVLANTKEYNKKYFGELRQQTVQCPCCQATINKISYPKHLKSKRCLAKKVSCE